MNIVIVSDHGMTSIAQSDVKEIKLDDYLELDLVENIADSGAFSIIKAAKGHVPEVS